MMMLNKPLMGPAHTGTPFLFRKRVEKIDWRRLAAVDVDRVASQMDIDTLQEILTSVAFCDITSEIDTRYVDTNFIKLFQLAQLLVEYLLYSQEYLTSTMDALKGENDELKKNIEQLQDRLVEKSNRLTVVRRECHRRRLLLLAQQQLMDSGPQSYHRCMYCAKAFLNASFLAAHVHRRHPETEVTKPTEDNRILTMTQQTSEQQQRQQQHQTFSLETAQVQNNNTQTTSLEREVRELLVQLKSFNGRRSPSNPVMFMKPSEISVPVQPADTNKTDDEEPSKPDWQTLMIEEHRRDMELLRNMFEKELRALQIQHASTQDELAQLKVKRVASNLGELVDDVPTSTIQRERIIHVGASARSSLPEHNTSSTKAIPVFDEPTLSASKASIGTEARTISEHVSKHSASSPQRSNVASRSEMRTISDRRPLSQSPLRASTSQVAETDDTADESDNQQVSRAMGHILTVSEASSPVQSVNMSTNVLRYSRLLDQLKSDPETLHGLRHEVEQLLMEQLAERGIEANETRLTTTALNDRLLILRRERENIARKHPDFFEIREALAQYVDRLANAMLHGKNVQRTSSSEIRPVPSRLQRASVIARSGLPPPAMHSPVGARKGGTLPIQASRRAEVGSGLGSSMPILGQHESISKTGKPQSSPLANFDTSKPYFQRSSPHLQFGETHPDELHSSRSGMSTASPRHRSELGTPPVGRSQLPSQAETPSPRKARGSPQRSRSTASPYRTPERSSALKSPSIQLSHDQRVITFNRPEVSNNPVAPTSSDEWDSEPDEPPITTSKSVDPRMNQLKMPHSMSKVPDVLGTGVDLDEADRFLNDLGERQRNSNALFNQDNPVAAPIPMTLNRAHSVRTDDEDICSVSSLNGGVADDTSLSLVPGTPTRRGSKVSRSLDPGVVAAKAQAAALGPRPGTRFGRSSRDSVSVAGAIPVSVGSPDMTNTLATSFWGTNSKAVSLSANVNSALKSEYVDDEDFDTDD